jgi:hypothetical protein
LNNQDVRKVERRLLPALFTPQPQKRFFVLAHDDPGVGAALRFRSGCSAVRKKSGQGGDNGYPACASLDHAQQDRIDRIEHPNHIGLDQRAADFRDFEISSGRSSAHDPCIGKQKINRRGGVECHEPGFELGRTADINERRRYHSAPFTAGHRDVVEPLLMASEQP